MNIWEEGKIIVFFIFNVDVKILNKNFIELSRLYKRYDID